MDCLQLRDPIFFANQIITGLAAGGIFALVALGFVLIYKASDVINFAQGDLLMAGAYIGWALYSLGLEFWAAFLLTLAVCGVMGLLIERAILPNTRWRPGELELPEIAAARAGRADDRGD